MEELLKHYNNSMKLFSYKELSFSINEYVNTTWITSIHYNETTVISFNISMQQCNNEIITMEKIPII